MGSERRSLAIAVTLALLVLSSGCLGSLPSDGTTETVSTDSDGATTTVGEPTTKTDDPTTTSASTTSTTDDSERSHRVRIINNATRVTPSPYNELTTDSEYITLEIGVGDPSFNLSGYTVTYGNGPTYTLPESVSENAEFSGLIQIFTGDGANRRYPPEGVPGNREPRYILHAGFDGPLVDQDGTTITLRNRSGAIIDQRTVIPKNGSVPLVPTQEYALEYLNGSLDSPAQLQRATPFALRAPTYLPEEYQMNGFSLWPGDYDYLFTYSREPNNNSDDIWVQATVPQATDRFFQISADSRSVTVGNQMGYYESGEYGDGSLTFIGPDGWLYIVRGPVDEQQLIEIGESIAIVDDNTTVSENDTSTPAGQTAGVLRTAPGSSG